MILHPRSVQLQFLNLFDDEKSILFDILNFIDSHGHIT